MRKKTSIDSKIQRPSSRKGHQRTKFTPKADYKRWFYTKNKRLLEHKVNATFDELRSMSKSEFRSWVKELRKVIVDLWDNQGSPPTLGLDENDIVRQFELLQPFPVASLQHYQAGSKSFITILNSSSIGSAANQWFPTMMKTKINDTQNLSQALSIYDYFSKNELFEKQLRYLSRLLRNDGHYVYAPVVQIDATDLKTHLFACKTGRDWIKRFESHRAKLQKTYDYWIAAPAGSKGKKATNRQNDQLRSQLTITASELKSLSIPTHCKAEALKETSCKTFVIRVFKKGQKIFPTGFKTFRHSFSQFAVNFPPLIAKYLYERYLTKLDAKEAIIWDPSAGWGGRILAAMALREEFKVHYIGTDPNTDHNTTKGRTKYHELADFYNAIRLGTIRSGKKRGRISKHINTYQIYQCGSEEMSKQPSFKKFKGKLDLVFTSPPYFAKEVYSDDATQSANKFDEYASWRDGFLKPTLETAVKWLKPGGYLLWNIANIRLGSKKRFPLEEDSCRILRNLGMKWVEILKMALARSPGAHREGEDFYEDEEQIRHSLGVSTVKKKRIKATAKHGTWIDKDGKEEALFKYEPVFIYRKPLSTSSFKKSNSIKPNPAGTTPAMERLLALLAKDFCQAISAKTINTDWLRAIYETLNKLLLHPEAAKLVKSFNRNKRARLFISSISSANKGKMYYHFAERAIVDASTKKLANTTVLVQFLDNQNGTLKRRFGIAEVLPPEKDDDPKRTWVKMSSPRTETEKLPGLRLKIRKINVFPLMRRATRLNAVKAKWNYKQLLAEALS